LEAILFIGHGSRVTEANEELLSFTRRLSVKFDSLITETCFLEWAFPNILQGMELCVKRGATRIILLPIMLFAAGHAKVDIPMVLTQARQKYPHVEFIYETPLGVDKGILPVLSELLQAVQPRRKEDTAVLLVGRGSSDPDANSDLYKIARLFWEHTDARWVEVAYYGVTDPLVEEGIKRCICLGAKEVIVLPYLLFTGVLISRLRQKLFQINRQYSSVSIRMGGYLGVSDQLVSLFSKRLNQRIKTLLNEQRNINFLKTEFTNKKLYV
jgi:sirohydrochlorin cobaltochelatase